MTDSRAELSAATWRTLRHALALAFARDDISEREYAAAMTEVMGTSDRMRW